MALEKFYTVREAAAALKVTEYSIWKWLQSGKLRGTKISNRRVIRESELQRLVVDDPPNA